jgi:hypothetical protein
MTRECNSNKSKHRLPLTTAHIVRNIHHGKVQMVTRGFWESECNPQTIVLIVEELLQQPNPTGTIRNCAKPSSPTQEYISIEQPRITILLGKFVSCKDQRRIILHMWEPLTKMSWYRWPCTLWMYLLILTPLLTEPCISVTLLEPRWNWRHIAANFSVPILPTQGTSLTKSSLYSASTLLAVLVSPGTHIVSVWEGTFAFQPSVGTVHSDIKCFGITFGLRGISHRDILGTMDLGSRERHS